MRSRVVPGQGTRSRVVPRGHATRRPHMPPHRRCCQQAAAAPHDMDCGRVRGVSDGRDLTRGCARGAFGERVSGASQHRVAAQTRTQHELLRAERALTPPEAKSCAASDGLRCRSARHLSPGRAGTRATRQAQAAARQRRQAAGLAPAQRARAPELEAPLRARVYHEAHRMIGGPFGGC